MFTPFRAVAAAASVVALAVAVAVPALTSADTPGQTITVRDKVRAAKIVDVAPKSKSKEQRLSLGDRVTTRQALFDESNRRVGTLYTHCVGAGPTAPLFGAVLNCSSTWEFKDGQVVGEGVVRLTGDASVSLPIVGGSGAYRGASGEVTPGRPVKGFDSVDVLHLDD
jgi:hypothetical protein